MRDGAVRDRIVAYIGGYRDEHGYSPTVREIAAAVGLSSSGVYHHLEQLRKSGVVKGGAAARTWRIAS